MNIGGAVVRRLLTGSEALVFNLDKCGYASDLTSIEALPEAAERHTLLQVDLTDADATAEAVRQADPDLVMHLAAESHVDRSIEGPAAFIASNVNGTFHLLQTVRAHWEQLPTERRDPFRFHHISTDEVFGSLGETGRFSETTPYDPRSPYSASKAASDHLVNAWHHTYGLPVVLTNCSNNYGPWQFPEKLIPVVILKAAAGEPIPVYGDGLNVRDWLFVDDHVDALLLAACRGEVGRSYCVGGSGSNGTASERTNKQVVEAICALLDQLRPAGAPHSQLITPVSDRPGHDRRYAIDPTRISTELGWQPRHSFEEGLAATVRWHLEQQGWCQRVREQGATAAAGWGCWQQQAEPTRGRTHTKRELGFSEKSLFGVALVAARLTTAAGAALIGADARELHQEFRRVLSAVARKPLRGDEAMGFRELLYFRVVGCLGEQGVRLTPEQKREIYAVFGRHRRPPQGNWLRREGQLVMRGAVPLSMDLSRVSQDLRYRYRLLQRPQGVVERNPAICSGQPVFSGTRIPVAVVVEQLRAGVSRTELEDDFPQLSRTALDYAEIQARLPKPPGRPRKQLLLQRRSASRSDCAEGG